MKSDEACLYAHHLFPVIVERTSAAGYKSVRCFDEDDCFWPKDVCGRSHPSEQGPGYAKTTSRFFYKTGAAMVCCCTIAASA